MGRSHVQNGQISEQIDGVNGGGFSNSLGMIKGPFPNGVLFGGNINDHVGVSSSSDQMNRLLDFLQLVGIGDDA